MRARRAAVVSAIVLAALTRAASGDPVTNVHIESSSHVTTVGGSELDLPPGFFLGEAARAALDTEVRRLQEAETRLTAENASLKASATDPAGWKPGLYTLATTFVLGMAAGIYLLHSL